MKALIIDDEAVVRAGLKNIIDWNTYGFDICGEADNGEEGLQKILSLDPDLVLLDIKMPGMYGVDIARHAREHGFGGKIIILSGYSDFEYAHDAIKSGVDAYLLKPIDEDELIEAVTQVKSKLDKEFADSVILHQSMPQMKNKIINDIICGNDEALKSGKLDEFSLYSVNLKFDIFEVAIADNMSESALDENMLRAELLKKYSGDESNIDTVLINDRTAVLLKGSEAVRRLPDAVEKMRRRGKDLKAGFFIGVGRCVKNVSDINLSYLDAQKIVNRRFFYDENQSIVFWDDINAKFKAAPSDAIDITNYIEILKSYIEVGDCEKIRATLVKIKNEIICSGIKAEKAIAMMINVYCQLKKKLYLSYPGLGTDSQGGEKIDIEVINCIYEKNSLFEIIKLLCEVFKNVSEKTESITGKNLMKRVENYISKNFMQKLKLEDIAQLFGYNSAYLGKLFKDTFGDNFNTYLDKVRIAKAKSLLQNKDLKVYEVSEQVGFKNIDYFYKKFKTYVGQSPNEYRKLQGFD